MNIFITGASGGIGLATAKYLIGKGHTVIGTSRHERDMGFPIYVMDATDPSSIDNAVSSVLSDFGHIDVLINSAGSGLGGAFEDYSDEQLQEELSLNTIGAVRVIRRFLPSMREHGGKIFCIGSVAGIVPIPFQSMYSASKAALELMCGSLRLELRGTGVQFCVVCPGDTKTGFTGSRIYAEGRTPFYKERCEHALNAMMHDEMNGKDPLTVAKTIDKQINKKRLPAKVTVCFEYKLLSGLAHILPRRLMEFVLSKIYLESKKDVGFRYQ